MKIIIFDEIMNNFLLDNLVDSINKMESGSLYAQIIVYSWVLINIGLSLILGSKMSMMLWVINWMQLVWYLPLMTSYFPKHVKIMYSLLSFANMDIQIFSDAFKRLTYIASDEMYPFNQRFENNDISSMLFFLVWYLPLMTSYFPKHVKIMYSLLSFANMDIQIFSDAFKRLTYIASDEMYPFNQRFENNDISSMLFFDNSASILFSMLLTVWSLMLAITLYLISCFPKCKKWLK